MCVKEAEVSIPRLTLSLIGFVYSSAVLLDLLHEVNMPIAPAVSLDPHESISSDNSCFQENIR